MSGQQNVPSRLIYMGAVLDALRANGGTAQSKDVYDFLIVRRVARPSDIAMIQPSGESRFVKEVRFARKELVDAGLLLNSTGGTWSLSPDGWRTRLAPENAQALVRRRRHGGLPNAGSSHHSVAPAGITPTAGPAPSDWIRLISRRANGEAWTYVMRYGETDVWKIGYAADVDARLLEINTHVPVEITGTQWTHFARHPWANSHLAFEMEQRLFVELRWVRTARERVRCSESDLLAAWRQVTGAALKR